MTISRRRFVAQASTFALGALSTTCARSAAAAPSAAAPSAAAAAPSATSPASPSAKPARPPGPTAPEPAAGGPAAQLPAAREPTWEAVRDEFAARRDAVHLASFLLSSHPRCVRDAIARHRDGLDADPYHYIHHNHRPFEVVVLARAAKYLGVRRAEIALTDSTTLGLGLLYQGLALEPGGEILTTTHDHYSTHEALRLRSARGGVKLRKVALYERSQAITEGEIVARLTSAITPATRVVALTWVHSNTGVKLPIAALTHAIARVNASRSPAQRVVTCVDGVHGFAVESEGMLELGCDFFVTGCHKWLYGPRGTGLIWARPGGPEVAALVPTMSDDWTWGGQRTPGGFHSFEHRWALAEAFDFHLRLGKARVTRRIRELNRALKEGLAQMSHVTLHTPLDDALSAGMVCFDVAGMKPAEVVGRLWQERIIASETPYTPSAARLAASILNSEREVDQALRVVRALA